MTELSDTGAQTPAETDTPSHGSEHPSETAGRLRTWTASTALLAGVLIAGTGTASAQHGGGGMMGSGGYGGFGIPGFGLVFLTLLALGIVLLVGYARDRSESDAPSADRALDTLRERYARGELSTEEFEARRAELERSK